MTADHGLHALTVPLDGRPMTVLSVEHEALVPVVLVEQALGYAPTKLGRAIRRWEAQGHIRPEHVRLIDRSEVSGDLLTRQASTPTLGVDLDLTGRSDLLTLTERGVYRVLALSRQPKALAFQDWLETQVLPAIRRTGAYAPTPTPAPTLVEQVDEMIAGVERLGWTTRTSRLFVELHKVRRKLHALTAGYRRAALEKRRIDCRPAALQAFLDLCGPVTERWHGHPKAELYRYYQMSIASDAAPVSRAEFDRALLDRGFRIVSGWWLLTVREHDTAPLFEAR